MTVSTSSPAERLATAFRRCGFATKLIENAVDASDLGISTGPVTSVLVRTGGEPEQLVVRLDASGYRWQISTRDHELSIAMADLNAFVDQSNAIVELVAICFDGHCARLDQLPGLDP